LSQVILVDASDTPTGVMDKMEVHEKGLLHRAFSIFIFNSAGEMLLQQRALEKYHSGGLWTNACCSHPQPEENTDSAAHRRLQQEMGFDTSLHKAFTFTYRSGFDNGLTEHEYDHVYVGTWNGPLILDTSEVMDHRYVSMDLLRNWMNTQPEDFTAWFKIAFPMVEDYLAGTSSTKL